MTTTMTTQTETRPTPTDATTLAVVPVVLGGPSLRRRGTDRPRRSLFARRGPKTPAWRRPVTPIGAVRGRAFSDR